MLTNFPWNIVDVLEDWKTASMVPIFKKQKEIEKPQTDQHDINT